MPDSRDLDPLQIHLQGHSLNKPMHDATHILGILAGLRTAKRLQYDVRTISDSEFGMLRVSRENYEITLQ